MSSTVASTIIYFMLAGAIAVTRPIQDTPVTRTTTVPASPSVLATVFITDARLGLLVLWRGSPNWWSKSSGHDGTSGSTQGRGFTMSLTYGSVTLSFAFDPDRHAIVVQGRESEIPEGTNVVLIDNADSPSGPDVYKALTIQSADVTVNPPSVGFGPLLSRSPEAVVFLKCKAGTMTPMIAHMACGELSEK
jgi:hypothetical protein